MTNNTINYLQNVFKRTLAYLQPRINKKEQKTKEKIAWFLLGSEISILLAFLFLYAVSFAITPADSVFRKSVTTDNETILFITLGIIFIFIFYLALFYLFLMLFLRRHKIIYSLRILNSLPLLSNLIMLFSIGLFFIVANSIPVLLIIFGFALLIFGFFPKTIEFKIIFLIIFLLFSLTTLDFLIIGFSSALLLHALFFYLVNREIPCLITKNLWNKFFSRFSKIKIVDFNSRANFLVWLDDIVLLFKFKNKEFFLCKKHWLGGILLKNILYKLNDLIYPMDNASANFALKNVFVLSRFFNYSEYKTFESLIKITAKIENIKKENCNRFSELFLSFLNTRSLKHYLQNNWWIISAIVTSFLIPLAYEVLKHIWGI